MGLITNLGGGSAPTSTDIKVGSYTIPAGFHALVKCLSAADSAFTVDSGSGAVVAEEKTHFETTRNSASGATLSTSLPTTVDTSMWRCTLHYTCQPDVRQQVSLLDSQTSSANQFANKAMIKSGEQNSNVQEGHDRVPLGSSTIATTTCTPFDMPSGGKVHLMNQDTFVTLAVYSWKLIGTRIRNGSMYEGVVPTGTILNGDRYSVTLYAN